ncbi:MAG: hypothetical protein WBO09_01660 [Methylocystis silviterrae]|uniref:hypothetical protein n=1 Tax=Methylocystis silviterrae TaxID=2743612 RepID=UPI003C736363
MTKDEMQRDLEEMQSYLSCTSLIVKRCEHESVTHTALWIFDKDGDQIASVSRVETSSKWKWEASKMRRSQPITRLPFEHLLQAAAYVVRHC